MQELEDLFEKSSGESKALSVQLASLMHGEEGERPESPPAASQSGHAGMLLARVAWKLAAHAVVGAKRSGNRSVAEIEGLSEDFQRLRTATLQLKADSEAASSNVAKIEGEFGELNDTVDALRRKTGALEEELHKAREDAVAHRELAVHLRDENVRLKKEREDAAEDVSRLRVEVKLMKSVLSEEGIDYESINGVTQALRHAEEEVREVESKIEALSCNNTELQEKVNSSVCEANELRERLKSLESQSPHFDTDEVRTLQQKVDELQAIVDELHRVQQEEPPKAATREAEAELPCEELSIIQHSEVAEAVRILKACVLSVGEMFGADGYPESSSVPVDDAVSASGWLVGLAEAHFSRTRGETSVDASASQIRLHELAALIEEYRAELEQSRKDSDALRVELVDAKTRFVESNQHFEEHAAQQKLNEVRLLQELATLRAELDDARVLAKEHGAEENAVHLQLEHSERRLREVNAELASRTVELEQLQAMIRTRDENVGRPSLSLGADRGR